MEILGHILYMTVNLNFLDLFVLLISMAIYLVKYRVHSMQHVYMYHPAYYSYREHSNDINFAIQHLRTHAGLVQQLMNML